MKTRLLCIALVMVVTQLVGTGCHPVSRWRANHPCGTYNHHPLLHPIQTRRAIFSEQGGGSVGPVVTNPPCHGCGSPGVPVSFGHGPGDLVPVTHPPTIGYPMPITPGPKVVPSYELPHPMPVPKNNGGSGN